jgi:hypothetical protein
MAADPLLLLQPELSILWLVVWGGCTDLAFSGGLEPDESTSVLDRLTGRCRTGASKLQPSTL